MESSMRLFIAAGILAATMLAASAHEPRKGPNGGALVDAGKSYHVELIARGSEEVVVVLSDINDKPVPAAGFKANAILIVGGKTQRFALEPADARALWARRRSLFPQARKARSS
jgi:hypothetical protein